MKVSKPMLHLLIYVTTYVYASILLYNLMLTELNMSFTIGNNSMRCSLSLVYRKRVKPSGHQRQAWCLEGWNAAALLCLKNKKPWMSSGFLLKCPSSWAFSISNYIFQCRVCLHACVVKESGLLTLALAPGPAWLSCAPSTYICRSLIYNTTKFEYTGSVLFSLFCQFRIAVVYASSRFLFYR